MFGIQLQTDCLQTGCLQTDFKKNGGKNLKLVPFKLLTDWTLGLEHLLRTAKYTQSTCN